MAIMLTLFFVNIEDKVKTNPWASKELIETGHVDSRCGRVIRDLRGKAIFGYDFDHLST